MDRNIGIAKLKYNPWNYHDNKSEFVRIFKKMHKKYHNTSHYRNQMPLLAAVFSCIYPVEDLLFDETHSSKLEEELETLKINSIAIRGNKGKDEEKEGNIPELLSCSEIIAIYFVSTGIIPKTCTSYGKDQDNIPSILKAPQLIYPDNDGCTVGEVDRFCGMIGSFPHGIGDSSNQAAEIITEGSEIGHVDFKIMSESHTTVTSNTNINWFDP